MRSVNEFLRRPTEAAEVSVPAELVRSLADAVAEAGARAHAMFGTGVRSWKKKGDSIVSHADMAIDAFLRDRLTALAPSFGWLSEETVDAPERLGRERVWVVDPIDGTRAFLAGDADWAVSAALIERGRPIAAALCAPVTGDLFVASVGRGATQNGATISARATTSLSGARVAGPRPMLDALGRIGHFERVPRIRSLALRFARAANGDIDAALASTDSNDWDLAAADLLVHEAGGLLTGFDGRAPVYNLPDPVHGALVAAGRGLHPVLLDAVTRVLPSGQETSGRAHKAHHE
jgi:myo-inositol-1(or 4)-monophosphatase